MINFLCHTARGDCEYFTWDGGEAKCTFMLLDGKPVKGLREWEFKHIPKMKVCPLAEKVPKLPHWRKNPNQGELFEASDYHRIEGR